ncbi:unannotated protein [freshwater metagenome]|uniref:Unannotated protein n=1 Tax=freshwater metagenome TaxID=449393 RepID=A0A6J6GTU8_9ZZZZ|nr:methyltransferase domain-containing protein [Actinomycetota bacterium]
MDIWSRRKSRARVVAESDSARDAAIRPFSFGTKPVIRWIKGDGLDDDVTRIAIATATRLFGDEVDYCLCTRDIDAPRARRILSWATESVDWWPISPEDNAILAERLDAAGCRPERFGYWWKWFPERVRPDAPEWILDGDMVITGRPQWFDKWFTGDDVPRISAHDSSRHIDIFGRYGSLVDKEKRMYSGLVSLPPGLRYMGALASVLDEIPLLEGHDGCKDMCEGGVIAATFQSFDAETFPLAEFPFARAFETELDFGDEGIPGAQWGYHFGASFQMVNHHFLSMIGNGELFSQDDPGPIERYAWLGNQGQWGVPGWSLGGPNAEFVAGIARSFTGGQVLEIGTSRGYMTAVLAELGCIVTSVDHVDRRAGMNLDGLAVDAVVADVFAFLRRTRQRFDLIIVDLHDNSPRIWRRLFRRLESVLEPGGSIVINNARLHEIPEWSEETGVSDLLANLPKGFAVVSDSGTVPGLVEIKRD